MPGRIDDNKVLQSIKNDLQELAKRAENLPQPEKAVFVTNLLLTMKKVDYLLGEHE